MGIKPYFEKIEDVIIEDIKSSKQQLLIAVAWFTNHKIFDALIEKLDGNDGFTAKLIVINDNINHRPGGLDFQRFVAAGGCLYFAEKNIPMHNKYMVIDSDIVITGSYNYTYYAETLNDENIVRINGDNNLVQSYIKNFNSLVSKKPTVACVSEYLCVTPPAVDMFSYNNYALKDISLQTEYYRQTNCKVEEQKLVKKLEQARTTDRHDYFVINNVIYKQWKSNFFIDKIEVRKDIITIFFRSAIPAGGGLFSPETKKAWIIQSSSDMNNFSRCLTITNVRINGEMVIDKAKNGTEYDLYVEESTKEPPNDTETVKYIGIPKNVILTCEISFKADNLELIDGTIDLVEGRFYHNNPFHWNALNIQMNVNREWL